MKKKYLSVIVLTSVFALALVACVVINTITSNKKANQNLLSAITTSPVVETQIIEQGGTTAIVPVVTTSPDYNSPSGMIQDYIDNIKNKPVINNPAYGPNYNGGGVDYYLDGQAVTTIYDTVESTKNGDTTAPEPDETTAAETTKKPETSKVPDTTKPPVQTTVPDTTTAYTETESVSEEETTVAEETTDATTEPVDNSEGEMLAESE